MAIPLTFLEAANRLPLAKTIRRSETKPYPRVKELNSHSYTVSENRQGLDEAFELFQSHAVAGNSFLKGQLRKPLKKESRAGQVDKYGLTQLLVIDIDGLPIADLPSAPFDKSDVQTVGKRVLRYLPEPLQDVSFIAHAGSSFGLDRDKVSMHLIFFLKRPVGPDGLKEWLISLNFQNEHLYELLELTPQNIALSYLIDPVLAQNTHQLFVADPIFEGVTNPFDDNNERWALVENGPATVDIIPMLSDVCPQQNKQQIEKRINELRKAKNLNKFKPKMRTVAGMTGEKIQVVSNPDQMLVEYAYENDEFVYFNVNGGDSNAYFCPKHNPDIIYNFKNEPPFELSKANPAVYEWYIENYAEVIRERSPLLPITFRDFSTDKHYAVLVNPSEDSIERMAEIQKTNLDDWMAEHGRSMPDPIPTWDVTFDPHSEIVYDPHKQQINRFELNPMLREPVEIMPQYHCSLGTAGTALRELCPIISTVIHHICGDGETEYEYFVNWLAASLQIRNKLATSWVFSGVPGTGKGVFYDHVLRPLIGESYARKKRIDHLEDKFDAHMAETLFVVYDEFRLSDIQNPGKVLNKIKDEIAAESGEIRAMRQESQTRKLYANYLFFSNHNDAMRIEEGDRRFNVAPPQYVKLLDKHPGLEDKFHQIADELPQFAAFMMNYTVNEHAARTCLENEAKERMKETAMAWHEQFCLAIRRGDLDYFLDDLIESSASNSVEDVYAQASAKKIVLSWVQDAVNHDQSVVPVSNLHAVYNALARNETTRKKFATMLSRNDVEVGQMRVNEQRQRSVAVTFYSKTHTFDDLRNLLPDSSQETAPWQPTTH